MSSLEGQLLIAMPGMADPNFNETVTYICKHDADGAIGIVVNRASDVTLGEICEQLSLEGELGEAEGLRPPATCRRRSTLMPRSR